MRARCNYFLKKLEYPEARLMGPTKADANHQLSLLMQKTQEGDSSAYRLVLIEVSGLVERFLRKRVSQEETRDDICQEILISVNSSLHTYDPRLPFLPWLYAIANFRLIDHWRKSGRAPEYVLLEDAMDELLTMPTSESPLEEAGLTEHIRELPEKQRRAIQLVKQEGLTIAEASKQLNMSESAVKVSIHRAIHSLRKKLGIEDNHEN